MRYRVMLTVLLLFGLGGCQLSRSQLLQAGSIQLTGVLADQQPQNCVSDTADCSPQYKLYQQDMREWFALSGSVDPTLVHYLVQVRGHWLDQQQRKMQVEIVKPLSVMPYHQFLVEAADQYTTSQYFCRLSWDKTYGWEIRQGQALFLVRLTRDPGRQASPRLQLRFDTVTRALKSVKEVNWPLQLCSKTGA